MDRCLVCNPRRSALEWSRHSSTDCSGEKTSSYDTFATNEAMLPSVPVVHDPIFHLSGGLSVLEKVLIGMAVVVGVLLVVIAAFVIHMRSRR